MGEARESKESKGETAVQACQGGREGEEPRLPKRRWKNGKDSDGEWHGWALKKGPPWTSLSLTAIYFTCISVILFIMSILFFIKLLWEGKSPQAPPFFASGWSCGHSVWPATSFKLTRTFQHSSLYTFLENKYLLGSTLQDVSLILIKQKIIILRLHSLSTGQKTEIFQYIVEENLPE